MRFRYFVTSLVTTVVLSIITAFAYYWFLYHERINLVDQTLRDTYAALLDSDLGSLRKIDFDKVDGILSQELGESRIGKFFIIRDSKGTILFKSNSFKLLNIKDIPQSPQWLTLDVGSRKLRVLNLQLPQIPDQTLQIGAVFDASILRPSYFGVYGILFFVLVIIVGAVCAFFLASVLLRPIGQLNLYVKQVINSIRRFDDIPPAPMSLSRYYSNQSKNKDEFFELLGAFENLAKIINRQHKITRQWTYQLAHELKTPITVLGLEAENYFEKYKMELSDQDYFKNEIAQLSEIINSFLSWAEIESARLPKKTYAINVGKVMFKMVTRLNRSNDNRINLRVDLENDFMLVCNQYHFEQSLLNILQNALNYSPISWNVDVTVTSNKIVIHDYGSGIPENVMERIGEPFNSGKQDSEGHGLGLAWVYSVARLYDWKIELITKKDGTTFSFNFNKTIGQDSEDIDLNE